MKTLRCGLARILFLSATITFLNLASASTMFAPTIRNGSENRATAGAIDFSSMNGSVIRCLKAVWEPGALEAEPAFEFKHKNRGAGDSSIEPVFGRIGRQALQPLSVSSQAANAAGALPQTYDQFLAQNAANEKNSEATQTFGVVVIGLLVVLALVGRWLLRR